MLTPNQRFMFLISIAALLDGLVLVAMVDVFGPWKTLGLAYVANGFSGAFDYFLHVRHAPDEPPPVSGIVKQCLVPGLHATLHVPIYLIGSGLYYTNLIDPFLAWVGSRSVDVA